MSGFGIPLEWDGMGLRREYALDPLREELGVIILDGLRTHPSPYLQVGFVNFRQWGIIKGRNYHKLAGVQQDDPEVPPTDMADDKSVQPRPHRLRNPYHPSRKRRRTEDK